MSRCVDEMQFVIVPILSLVVETHRLCLNRNAALTFQIHIIENLGFHLTLCQRPCIFNQPVRNRRFAMVDVCNNRKITDELFCHRKSLLTCMGKSPVIMRYALIISLSHANLQERND